MLLQMAATCEDQVNLLSNTTPNISVYQLVTKEFHQLIPVAVLQHYMIWWKPHHTGFFDINLHFSILDPIQQ